MSKKSLEACIKESKNLISNNETTLLTEEIIKLDELNEEKLETFAENWRLVSLIEQGLSVKAAKSRINSSQSERAIRNLFNRYKSHGQRGLIDGRWTRTNPVLVLTHETKNIILGYYYSYPAAGSRLIWQKVCAECENRNLPKPSESSVKKYLESLPEPFKLFRNGEKGIRKWEQTAAPVIRYENTTYSNERWQGDHSPLPIWVRVQKDNEWTPRKVFISTLLDSHSRAVPGYVISCKHPDSWTISLLFYRSILGKTSQSSRVCGIPSIFQSDRGADFLSKSVRAFLAKLKICFAPDYPYYPNSKGKVERIFETLDIGCLRALPGHALAIGTTEGAALKRVRELLTLQQLDQEIENWIFNEYHQRIHSETGRKPAEFWEETVHLKLPESEEDFSLLLLKEDIDRTVINTGIRLNYKGQKHVYWSPELVYYFRQKVRLAYNPEDMESVLVYCADTGKRLCEAFDMKPQLSRYTIEDIKSAKTQFRYGLKERIKNYMEEVRTEDRRITKNSEWKEAREKLAKESPLEDENTEANLHNEEIMLLIKKFRNRDRAIN